MGFVWLRALRAAAAGALCGAEHVPAALYRRVCVSTMKAAARGVREALTLLCCDLFWPPGCSTPNLETHGDFSKNRGLLKDWEKQLMQMWGISLRRV